MNTLIKNNKKAKAIFIGLCLIVLAAIHAAGVFFSPESGMTVYSVMLINLGRQ
jgi:hypothetical protein